MAGLIVGTAACTATVRSDYPSDDYVVVDDAPPDIYASPRYAYGDGYAYLYGDNWYYRGSTGAWVVLRNEPPALYHHRYSYWSSRGYTAAPAYRPSPWRRPAVAPPAYGGGPQSAPPAYRHHHH